MNDTEPLDLPLKGVRILSAEQYGAGPFGSMQLADLGAEVIKIENPADGGDISRRSGHYNLNTPDGKPDSQFFQTFNRNKKSLTLNMKSDAGQALFRKLAGTADAVMNNLRGDQPAKLGLDYASLGSIKQSMVCVHLSAYGRKHERENWPGYDYLMQAEAGYLHLTGEPDGAPTRMGLSIVDYMTGITTAMALLAGLMGAARTGRGRDIDVSLFDVALAQLTYPATWFLNSGHVTERMPRSGHPSAVPVQLVKASDGWVFIMCVTPGFWEKLCTGVAHPEWLTDPRFITPPLRHQNRGALSDMLDQVFQVKPVQHWVDRLSGKIPIAPVLNMQQALTNPFVGRTGMIQPTPHPADEDFRLLASPVQLDGHRLPGKVCSPLSADTNDLLREIGCDDQTIGQLRRDGIV